MIPDNPEPTQNKNNEYPPHTQSTKYDSEQTIRIETMSIFHSLRSILFAAIIMATVFTMWTPSNLFNNSYITQVLKADEASSEPTPNPTLLIKKSEISTFNHIGIIAGHWKYDPGATCDDGLREVDINVRIATLVKQNLEEAGFEVDLLAEHDELLDDYQGLALLSIHNDTCVYMDGMSGFKTAPATELNHPEQSKRFQACMDNRYQNATNLEYHPNQITDDMSDYHAFREINPNTPALIIETGFMNQDRDILTKNADLIAKGISDGILCFLNNESLTSSTATPNP